MAIPGCIKPQQIDIIVSFPLFIAISLTLTSIVTISQGPYQGINWMSYDFKPCSESGVGAYTIPLVKYIILCPRSLPPNLNPTILDRDKVYPPEFQGSIDTVRRTMSVTILHEMVHALFPDCKYIL